MAFSYTNWPWARDFKSGDRAKGIQLVFSFYVRPALLKISNEFDITNKYSNGDDLNQIIIKAPDFVCEIWFQETFLHDDACVCVSFSPTTEEMGFREKYATFCKEMGSVKPIIIEKDLI